MLYRALSLAFGLALVVVAAPKQAVTVLTAQHVNFAPGGAIRITGSTGQLNIEGWDRPEVQIQVTRTLYREDTPAERERVKKQLEAIRLSWEQPSPGQLVLSTVFPKHRFPVSLYSKCEVGLDYRIMVPRNSKLEIQHAMGDVTIYDVSGDLDARIRSGDIVAQLPQPGNYQIDARSGLGTVYTDLGGTWRAPFLIGQRFSGTAAAPARQIHFRSGVGGISIVKMSAPAAVPVTVP